MVSSLLSANSKFSEKGFVSQYENHFENSCRKRLNKVKDNSHFLHEDRIWGADHNRISVS